jgi:hypothetical protein
MRQAFPKTDDSSQREDGFSPNSQSDKWQADCLSGDRKGGDMVQRHRDLISGEVTLDYFMRKMAEGWRIAAIEWVRDVHDQPVASERLEVAIHGEELPYGLQVASDGLHLEQNPLEKTVLLMILEKIVREKRITEIAFDLNAAGLKTRRGTEWTATEVFELLPRLIDMGPKLLSSQEWQERRRVAVQPN